MRIGILGATGPAGRSLAARLASVGFDVVIGSRSRYRALEVRDGLVTRWHDRHLPIDAADNEGAASADVVVVATPWDAAAPTAGALAERLDGKVVISMANALTKIGNEFQPLFPARGSIAVGVQAALPGSKVAAAFHHVPAKELGMLDHPVECDVLVCADHPEAKDVTMDIVGRVPGLRALDCGGLSAAAPVEAFTAVLLQCNIRYKTRVAVRFTGIPEEQAAPPEAPAEAEG